MKIVATKVPLLLVRFSTLVTNFRMGLEKERKEKTKECDEEGFKRVEKRVKCYRFACFPNALH